MNRGKIGFLEAFTIGVGGMIGGGIFAVLGLSISITRYAAPLAFGIAGLVALLTGYSYAKLSVRYPSRGGTIEFLVKGLGTGILAGGLNILLFISYTVMIALYAFAFGHYVAAGLNLGGSWVQFLEILIIIAFTAVNALGASISGRVEDSLVLFKLGILVLIAGSGLFLVDFSKISPTNWPSLTSVVAGGMVIFLAYEGFELISNSAMDVYDHKILPKAFYASILVTVSIYILIAIVSVGVLPLNEVIRAKDYALAIVAEPTLGKVGFVLVVIGAALSTASAINATIYGTAGVTYLVAKLGYLPKSLGKNLWKGATEGLIVVSLISMIFAVKAPLEIISTAGSSGFLLIFAFINYVAYKLRKEIKANSIITLFATFLALLAFSILMFRQFESSPSNIMIFLIIVVISFFIEYLVRKLTKREIRFFIDESIEYRERLLNTWKKWLPELAREIRKVMGEVEVYLVGSYARNEKGHDIDLLIVAKEGKRLSEIFDLVDKAARNIGIEKGHPLHIHYLHEKDIKKLKKKIKEMRKL